MGKYLEIAGGGSYYVVGDQPSEQIDKLARYANEGTLPDRLTELGEDLAGEPGAFGGLFALGVCVALVGIIVAMFIGLFGGAGPGWTAFWIGISLGGFVGVAIPVMLAIYAIVSVIVQSRCRTGASWLQQLEAQPGVVRLSGDANTVRPAVAALGGTKWIKQHYQHYGPAIDEFLTRPEIVLLEEQLAADGIKPKLRKECMAELRRIAEGSVKEYVAECAAEQTRDKAESVRIRNAALREYLDAQIKTITTAAEVKEQEELR